MPYLVSPVQISSEGIPYLLSPAQISSEGIPYLLSPAQISSLRNTLLTIARADQLPKEYPT
ncbi:hypothetical protein DPMN_074202 [Dreissena polymorpha]|uniref:Uncharacterized protein n=1 Tax=Dreissena polymorpha TaxID=45954 RepID=A0A9D3YFS3_DREPO|nr:hypothetical protein DPMN_074202 [Dreissena polymorpha]